jgi:hypothetical protein
MENLHLVDFIELQLKSKDGCADAIDVALSTVSNFVKSN